MTACKVIQGPWKALPATIDLKPSSVPVKRRQASLKVKLEKILETEYHFRDYSIMPASRFGTVNRIAVHQRVDAGSMVHDVENALYDFQRDGFGHVVFYV